MQVGLRDPDPGQPEGLLPGQEAGSGQSCWAGDSPLVWPFLSSWSPRRQPWGRCPGLVGLTKCAVGALEARGADAGVPSDVVLA